MGSRILPSSLYDAVESAYLGLGLQILPSATSPTLLLSYNNACRPKALCHHFMVIFINSLNVNKSVLCSLPLGPETLALGQYFLVLNLASSRTKAQTHESPCEGCTYSVHRCHLHLARKEKLSPPSPPMGHLVWMLVSLFNIASISKTQGSLNSRTDCL